jgi:hypothetical protein
MTRREAKSLIRESCNNLTRDSISLSFDFIPLPNPPLELPDFPADPPSKSSKIIQQALGISSADTAGFYYRLEQIIEIDEPSFVKRNITPMIAREKWLLANIDLIAEKILILQIKDFFASALDENSPDTDRWYIAVSILIGLILKGSEITESECFNLFLSIIVARQPGARAQNKSTGPHHISWNGQNSDTNFEEIAHPSGVLAANTILDILELYESKNSTVLPYWLERLSVSEQTSNTLNIPLRVHNLVVDCEEKSSLPLVMAAIQSLSHHPDESKEALFEICKSQKAFLRRNLASMLPRIDSEDRGFAKILLEALLNDEDSDTRVISTTYLGSLARFEVQTFIDLSKKIFIEGDSRMIQRLVDSGIRYYLSMDSSDSEGLIPLAWVSSNLESRSKLSGMLIQLAKINIPAIQKISLRILELSPESYNDLFNRINTRDPKIAFLIKNNQS